MTLDLPVSLLLPLLAAAGDPARGAELSQVVLATSGAMAVTAGLLYLCFGHRSGRVRVLGRAAQGVERLSGLPGWAALPSLLAAVSLLVALLGMYWDIALHIDQGRDPGPLANPAHYLILVGLYGILAAGVLAIALPLRERPWPSAIRFGPDWPVPVGGVLMAAAGAFALIGFPLDDVWHRLFGQDVTLWGPTHLMLIGGAGMSLVGQSVLLAEGMRARPKGSARLTEARRGPGQRLIITLRRTGLMGGLLLGLSTFQAEFDFGVPQYRLLFQPMLIALAGGVALVAARLWIGRGGALGAALFFLAARSVVSLIVGPVIGETTPSMALYLVEAACVELAALSLVRRPLALGAVSGALIGSVGLAGEWAWTQVAMPLPWTADLLPEAVVVAVIAGVAGGLLGALLALGLRGGLPRPAVARAVTVLSIAAVAALVAHGLMTGASQGARAAVALQEMPGEKRTAHATVRLDPPDLARDAAWVTVTAWQGGGLHVDRLAPAGEGVFRTNRPIPLHGDWKAILRVHRGDRLLALPIYMPADSAIPAAEVPAPPAFTRRFAADAEVLQRERDFDAPGWLWKAAGAMVLAIYLAFIAALAWGVGRVGRRGDLHPEDRPEPPTPPSARTRSTSRPTPIGARS